MGIPASPVSSNSAPKRTAQPTLGPSDNMKVGVVVVGALVASMWVIELVDAVLSHRLDRFGVRPHQIVGLRGIAFAPFLHASWQHLIGNTVPLAVLALIVAARSVARFVSVAVIVAFVSGLGMWLLGSSNEVHIGASGVVFGLLTYVIVRGFFARQIGLIVLGVVVGAVYGGILVGVLPTNRAVSWQGHLFGALGGVLASYLLDRRRGRHGGTNPNQ